MNSIVEFYINYRVIAEIVGTVFAFLLIVVVIFWQKKRK